MRPLRPRIGGLAVAACVLLAACGGNKARVAAYSPHENLLSIAAEFELLDARDPYAHYPAEELTGHNIARATLVRLANYSALHPGRFAPEVLVLKARAYERLGDYEGARRAYREAASYDSPLKEDALRRAALDERLLAIRQQDASAKTLEDSLRSLQRQAEELRKLGTEIGDAEYQALARVEAESAEVQRAEMLAANRWILPDGEAQALEALRTIVANHSESRRGLEHALRLARFQRELAEEEARLNPPETLEFRADRAFALLDDSLEILYRVSQADGRPERLVAARELDAVLALKEMLRSRAD